MNITKLLQTLLPSILDFIKSYYQRNQEFPTIEQIQNHTNETIERLINEGEDWLNNHLNNEENPSSDN